jgi:hypothetical protein
MSATLLVLTLLCRLQEAHPKLADVVNREVSIVFTTLMEPLTLPQETPSVDQPQPKRTTARQQKYLDERSQLSKYRATAQALLNKKQCKFTWGGYGAKDKTSARRKTTIYNRHQYFVVYEGEWFAPGPVSGNYGFYQRSGKWGIKFAVQDSVATCYKWPASPSVHDEIVRVVANLKLAYKTDVRSVVCTVTYTRAALMLPQFATRVP